MKLAEGCCICRRAAFIGISILFFFTPVLGHAQSMWSARGIASYSDHQVRLRADGRIVAAVDKANVRNTVVVFDDMTRQVGIPAELFIADMPGLNAYATNQAGVNVVVMSIGMLNTFAGEYDIYAAIIGHELAHLARGHSVEGQSRDTFLGLVGFIAGIAIDASLAGRYRINTDIGRQLAGIGATLVSRKYSRDQEREADQLGVQWMHQAGYNTQAAIRLWQRMPAGSDSFLSTHPHAEERAENIKTYAATLPPSPNRLAASKLVLPKLSATDMQVADFKYEEGTSDDLFVLALKAYNEARYEEAYKYAKQSADEGDPRGQFGIGFSHYVGLVVKQDFQKAADYFQRSANQGSSISNTYLGYMYQHGLGVKKDYTTALSHYQKAADTGYPNALSHLAEMYYAGMGVDKNPEKALQLATQAANKQDVYGEFWLGHALYFGWGGAVKDYSRAETLFASAARRHLAVADSFLGFYYSEGAATAPNYALALKHLKQAESKSEPFSKHFLASLYFKGTGVEQDYGIAKKLFQESFRLGLGISGAEISYMYVMGYGVQKDWVKAYAWIEAAAMKSGVVQPIYIEMRNRLNAALTPDQKEQGIALTKKILAGVDT